MFRSKAEKKVIDAGFDPARLPPGQYLTEKWPVLHAGSVPHVELETWDLRIWGEVDHELRLGWEELLALPSVEVTQDIHCVTRWSKFDLTFKGVPWRELAPLVAPRPGARYAIAHAEQGFTANVPVSFLEREGALLAYEADGEPLSPEHGWPLRLVDPGQVLLEERQVAARDRALGLGQARLLGALRLPQRRRPLRGAALLLLSANPSNEGTSEGGRRRYLGYPSLHDPSKTAAPSAVFSFAAREGAWLESRERV